MATPRGDDGRFLCVPTYPRLRTSSCGCGGGGLHPCPIAKRLAPKRAAAKASHKRGLDTAEIEELERELDGVETEREYLHDELANIRSRIQAAGSKYHRARDTARYGNVSRGQGYSVQDKYGDDSERAYEDLLNERKLLRAHEDHLRVETRTLKAALRRARGGRQLAGAARVKTYKTVIIMGGKRKSGPVLDARQLPLYRLQLENAGFHTSLVGGTLYARDTYSGAARTKSRAARRNGKR